MNFLLSIYIYKKKYFVFNNIYLISFEYFDFLLIFSVLVPLIHLIPLSILFKIYIYLF